ncbi:MAG: hypothetical protein P9L92_04745 [Candidatus Electryonea clarkiae]|nr:hypothetical protein [Candidatus Electryonea clarkiae]MDP8288473.1 hypothetical protein [Candidatus Electryonea clarkiae]
MFGLIGILVDGAIFWFITVFVSQQHRLIWWEFILWILLAKAGNFLVLIASESMGEIISPILSTVLFCGIMYFALHYRFHIHSLKEKNLIVSVYLVYKIIVWGFVIAS